MKPFSSLAIALAGYRNATADPLVRRLTVRLAGFPEDSPPVRIVLFSDLHVHGPDMPPRRVARIMDEIDALHPDLILAAGDFVRWVKQLVDVAGQVADAAGEGALRDTAREVLGHLRRGVVAYSSLD